MSDTPFWERPEIVLRFAAREPDHRLARLVEEYPDPAAVRVLDLGAAAGRNAVFLAARGFDFTAIDASAAMVAETSRRVGAVLGDAEALRRVALGRMDDLSRFPDEEFDLVVALGVLHSAGSAAERRAALAETARVTKRGGRVLVADFTDEHDPDGRGLVPAPDEPNVFLRESGRCWQVSAAEMDREMAEAGLFPLVPTETVRKPTDAGGCRVVANGLYGRPV